MKLPTLIPTLLTLTITQASTIAPEVLALPVAGTWTYGANLTSGEIHPGDGFTIFDFSGFSGFGVIEPGWIASSAPFGSPWGIAPTGIDSPSPNLTFTYTGPPLQSIVLTIPLGAFEATTTNPGIAIDDWTSRDHLIGSIATIGDGAIGNPHTDNILVPSPRTTFDTPDGGPPIALLGFALLSIEALRRKLAQPA